MNVANNSVKLTRDRLLRFVKSRYVVAREKMAIEGAKEKAAQDLLRVIPNLPYRQARAYVQVMMEENL